MVSTASGSRSLSALGALACLLAVAALWPASARATSAYGELTRFGEGGNKPGQIDDSERAGSNGETLRDHLIGVDPTDNSVFVLDEPEDYSGKRHKPTRQEEKECKEEEEIIEEPVECGRFEGPLTRHLRLQKFSQSAGHYSAVASAQLAVESPEGWNPSGQSLAVEGLAVDPALGRVYLLVVDARKKGVGAAETGLREHFFNEPVAAEVLAFSTKDLAPAGKAGKGAVLTGAGETELAAQSPTPGRALLEPTGLAVDPENHDLIIAGHEDLSSEKFDIDIGALGKPPTPDHYVLERVSGETGEVVPGAAGRWVDSANFFEHVERAPRAREPNSPVVVGPAGHEHVDLEYESRIAALSADFAAAPAPEYVYGPQSGAVSAGAIFSYPLGGDELEGQYGGALSATPYGPEGNTIYATTLLVNEQPGVGGADEGVMGISATTDAQTGWVGAQSFDAPRPGGEPKYSCVIGPAEAEYFNPVAAGSEGKVFVLALEYLEKNMREAHEEGTYEGPELPGIVEFGPGGGGCPQAAAGGFVAEVSGELLGERSVTMAEPVTFSSYVNQADALRVEWDFGDGTSETVTPSFHCPAADREAPPHQCPTVTHTFAAAGRLTVTEKVFTDDLSTPTIVQQTTVNVAGEVEAQAPIAVATGPVRVTVGHQALFDGSFSYDPAGPNEIREYHWNFGDGHETTVTTPTIEHLYAAVGDYTVTLAVTDAAGATSSPVALPQPVAVVEEIVANPETQTAGGNQTGISASVNKAPPAEPNVSLARAAAVASSAGTVALRLRCPSGETICAGSVELSAVAPAARRHGKKIKPRTTILGSGTFSLRGGETRTVVVKLTRAGRALLARMHRLYAHLTIAARDSAVATHTTRTVMALQAPPARRRR